MGKSGEMKGTEDRRLSFLRHLSPEGKDFLGDPSPEPELPAAQTRN